MKKKQFKLGRTETGVLKTLKEESDENVVIRKVLYQGLAASINVVSNAIERLLEKGLVSRNSTKLTITEFGKHFADFLE